MSMDDKWQNAFRKRHRTMFNKAHALKNQGRQNIRIYLVIERLDDESLYYWNSNPDDRDWPLSTDEIVSFSLKISGLDSTES